MNENNCLDAVRGTRTMAVGYDDENNPVRGTRTVAVETSHNGFDSLLVDLDHNL